MFFLNKMYKKYIFVNMEGIGDKLRKLRTSRGLSQEDIASSIGITRGAYTMIENNKTKSISIDVGKGIVKALGVSFLELFEIEAVPAEIDKLNEEISFLKDAYNNATSLHDKLIAEIESLKRLVIQLIIIIHTKDILVELMSFDRMKGIRNNRHLQIERLNNLIAKQKTEIESDILDGIYTRSQYKDVYSIMDRSNPGKFYNVIESVDVIKILDDNQFNIYSETG